MFIFSCLAFGQKLKIKRDIAQVDGKEFVKVVEDPASDDSYNIATLDGKDLFYLKFNSYIDPKMISSYNERGIVSYYEVFSPDMNTVYFEMDTGGCLMCHLATDFIKNLYFSKAVNSDGSINQDKLEILSKKIGFEFSKKRDEMKNSGTNTVIIQDSRPRNGVNIRIGN